MRVVGLIGFSAQPTAASLEKCNFAPVRSGLVGSFWNELLRRAQRWLGPLCLSSSFSYRKAALGRSSRCDNRHGSPSR